VATEENPADIGTRYVSTEDLKSNKLWFEGPAFLRDAGYKFKPYITTDNDLSPEGLVEMKTPTNSILFNSELEYLVGEEARAESLNYIFHKRILKCSIGMYWNGLQKFRKFLSIIFTVVLNLRRMDSGKLAVYEKVNNFIYRLSQRASFNDEISTLERGGKLKSGHILSKYNPYLDECGILRSNSRLEGLDYLPEEMRKPIILYATDPLTKLIVLEAHFKYEHSVSRSLLLSVLHKSFIVIGITKLIKSISAKCLVCQKRKAQPVPPQMSRLQNRIGIPNRAFAETGLDFAGPFETIQGRGKRRKIHYVLVLTCMQTRAVHFEATDGQKTSSVINALSRFASCRGRPRVLVSDNQTSFKSASKELRDFYQFYLDNYKDIENELHEDESPIQWIFIPPRAPHFGGSWEIMVKAMKRALSVISRGQPMTEDDFRTFLAKAMDMINMRPLLKHYSQETAHVLTPNDFLLGRCQVGIVSASVDPPLNRLGERWRQLECMSNRLWQRFIAEILPEISPRQKWKKEFNNLEVGTLVLIIDPNLPRNVWKIGVVEAVDISRDGFARSATVRTNNKTYERPVIRLIPLE
jgi:hypothetical protein